MFLDGTSVLLSHPPVSSYYLKYDAAFPGRNKTMKFTNEERSDAWYY